MTRSDVYDWACTYYGKVNRMYHIILSKACKINMIHTGQHELPECVGMQAAFIHQATFGVRLYSANCKSVTNLIQILNDLFSRISRLFFSRPFLLKKCVNVSIDPFRCPLGENQVIREDSMLGFYSSRCLTAMHHNYTALYSATRHGHTGDCALT